MTNRTIRHHDEGCADFYQEYGAPEGGVCKVCGEEVTDRTIGASEHGPDWSDYRTTDHPEEGPSCKCGFNGTPEECAADRTIGS